MTLLNYLLTSSVVLALLTLSATCYAVVLGIYNIYFHPLRKYPGPRLWAASILPSLWYSTHGELVYKLTELHERFGHVVRIAPDEVAYIGQEAQKDIYAFGGGSGPFTKSPDFYFSLGGAHSIVTTPSNGEHAKVRKIPSPSFSNKATNDQEESIMKFTNLFIQRLHERVSQGPQDLSEWFNLITFDIIGDLAFGEPFESVDSGRYHPWVRTMTQNNIWSVLVGSAKRLPLLQPFLQRLIPQHLKEEMKQMITYTKDKVASRVPQGFMRDDFMGPLLRAGSFIAGSDTTASLLSGLTYHLCQNPHVLDKLTAEVRLAFQSDKEINLTSVNSLTYTLAVLKEGLRLFPPASAGLPRRAPKGGATIAGQWVPEGTRVHVSPWASYRSSSRFYIPESFVPERWLGDSRFANDELKIVTPFSIGPRNCIGMNLAYAEMRTILAKLV
ncbi:hypothetical protein N7466_000567 [Penicillium verhagenii]|uniref:uncharacterized protein n=1 Tax=Penicillium verhagenii TaxID=1562060 RepID=UPI0025457760|nr:uncharacterized protein N7466_000567 [Penicillium verhagenii]KAJ5947552.1 hypothetical protein N7466_000567 [Penicillium verhagenii]